MRVLLINPNPFRPAVPPLGLEYVGEALRRAGHAVVLHDSPNTGRALEDSLRESRPDAVGITVRNLDTGHLFNSISFIPELERVVRAVRAGCQAPVILGGAGFSLLPEVVLAAVGADFGVVGEGEDVLPALLADLSAARRLPNLVIRDPTSGRVEATPRRLACAPPCPLARDLVDHLGYYARYGSFPRHSLANVQTSRGCVKKCTYCAEPTVIGSRILRRDPEEVVEEIRALLARVPANRFFFTDSELNASPAHAASLCEALLRHGLRLEWSAYLTPDDTDRELIELMRRAGCVDMIWSIESASAPVLAGLGKSYSPDDVVRVVGICRELGQRQTILLMVGGHGETPETIEETARRIGEAPGGTVAVVTGVRVYPKTVLARQAIAEGAVADEAALLEPVFYRADYARQALFPVVQRCFGGRPDTVVLGPERKTKFD